MNYKGVVTNCDIEFCVITLDYKITVYASHFFNHHNSVKIPVLNEVVLIENAKFYSKNVLYLDSDSNIMCKQFYLQEDVTASDNFMNLIKDKDLTFLDVMNMIKIKNMFETIFPNSFYKKIENETSIRDLVFNIFYLKSCAHNLNVFTPVNYEIPDNIKTICCKNWTFCVYNSKPNEYLVGFIRVSSKFGFKILSDDKYFLVCEISPDLSENYSKKMSKILNNFVIVKNYYIITEIFENNDLCHYVFVNIQNVHPVKHKTIIQTSICDKSLSPEIVEIKMKVIHRATVTLKNNILICWLHCSIWTSLSKKYQNCICQLKGKQFSKYPIYNTNDEYVLKTKETLFLKQIETFCSKKMYKIHGETLPVFTIPQDAEIELISCGNSVINSILKDFSFTSFNEAEKVLQDKAEQSNLISFEAVIKEKCFNEPFFKTTLLKNKAFGTPGNKVPHLILTIDQLSNSSNNIGRISDFSNFLKWKPLLELLEKWPSDLKVICKKYDEDEKSPLLHLYLQDWNEMQMPLGMIPGMKVVVRLVKPHHKYFKTCFISSITPVEYQPKAPFNSCFPYIENSNWGPSCNISLGHLIPEKCFCWCRSITIKITYCSFHHFCSNCKRKFQSQINNCCEKQNVQIDFMFAIKIRDVDGFADVICKDLNLLKVILNYSDKIWKIFTQGIRMIGYFTTTTTHNWEQMEYTDGQKIWCDAFSTVIKLFNVAGIHQFDLKCRKILQKSDDYHPKWYLIEARRTYTEPVPRLFL